jgi:dTDP-4-amino-4,6-dideoxygalactose transaminase
MSRHAWQRYGAAGFRHYDITEAGYKWNMFDLQAALGLAQFQQLEEWHRRRVEIVSRYRAELESHPAVKLLEIRPHVRPAHHLFVVKLVPEALRRDRDHILQALQAEGIGVAVHYRALHQHTFYRENFGYQDAAFPVATQAADNMVSLPLFPGMTDRDAGDVITALRRVLDFYAV